MRIGIVTPAFNVAPYIGDAIRSVLAQTHHAWTMTSSMMVRRPDSRHRRRFRGSSHSSDSPAQRRSVCRA